MGELALSVSSHSAAPANSHLRAICSRRREQNDVGESVKNDETNRGRDARLVQNRRKDYLLDVSSHHSQMRKPKPESIPWRKQKDDDRTVETALLVSGAVSSINKFVNDGTFMEKVTCEKKDGFHSNNSHVKNGQSNSNKGYTSKINISNKGSSVISQESSSNQLAAKAMQFRLKGKHEEANNLLVFFRSKIFFPVVNSFIICFLTDKIILIIILNFGSMCCLQASNSVRLGLALFALGATRADPSLDPPKYKIKKKFKHDRLLFFTKKLRSAQF